MAENDDEHRDRTKPVQSRDVTRRDSVDDRRLDLRVVQKFVVVAGTKNLKQSDEDWNGCGRAFAHHKIDASAPRRA